LWTLWLVRDLAVAGCPVNSQRDVLTLEKDAVYALDHQVKQAFDPFNLFAPIRPTKGLESASK